MDKVEKTRFILCLFIIVLECCYVLCDGIRWTKYVYNDKDNQRCLPSATALEVKVTDPVTCGRMSHINTVCDSFHYQPDTHLCIGCRYKQCVAPTLQTDKEQDGSSFFALERNVQSDCTDILRTCPEASNGTYEIKLWKSKKTLKVYCDMETAGGGWTVFQNRFNGSVDFYRNFSEFENGFGVPEGELWLGLKYVQEIADQSSTEIRLVLSGSYNNSIYHGYEEFQGFHLSGPNYTLNVHTDSRSFSGGMMLYNDDGNGLFNYFYVDDFGLAASNGYDFSTFDLARGKESSTNCAERYKDAYWYKDSDCMLVHLNAVYDAPEKDVGFVHFGFGGYNELKTSRMMIRRI